MIFNQVFYVIYFVYHQLYKLLLETMQQIGIVEETFRLSPNFWRNKYDIKFWVDGRGKLIKKDVKGTAVPDYTTTKCKNNVPDDCSDVNKIAQVYIDTIGSSNLIKKDAQGKGLPHVITASSDLVAGGAYYRKLGMWGIQDLASSTISRRVLNWQILAVMMFYLMTPLLNIAKQARTFLRNAGLGGQRYNI